MQIGLGLSITAQLRFGSSLSSYAVNDFDPSLVFDFEQNYYRTGGTDNTLSSSVTHAATSNATMIDSDGLLKWRPHNLLTHSGDLTNSGWTTSNLTVTAGQNDFEGNTTAFKLTPTASSGLHRVYKTTANSNTTDGILTTATIDLKADGYNFFSIGLKGSHYAVFNLSDGTVTIDSSSVSPTVTSLGNGWYRCSITSTVVTQEVFSVGETSQSATFGSSTFTGDGTSGVLVAYPHTNRSDLGGMVNNPAQPTGFETYVPTTSSAVYLPRVGHHIYNGSAWVNEGVLHESEARTNLIRYSNNFTAWSWVNGGVNATKDVTGLDGLTSAWTLTDASTSSLRGISFAKSSSETGTFTASVFVKKDNDESRFPRINFYTPAGASISSVRLNTKTGALFAVSATNSLSSVVEDIGDFWRVSLGFTDLIGSDKTIRIFPADSNTIDGTESNATTGSIVIFGAQMEAGPTPSSYIPNAGATASVTRAAETLTVPAANMPWPTPVVIGSELVTNGTFDTDTSGWTANNASLSVDSNGLKVTATGSYGGAFQDFTIVTGKTYIVTANFTYGDITGYLQIEDRNGGGMLYNGYSPGYSSDTSVSAIFTAVSDLTRVLMLQKSGGSGNYSFWDNISVKEVNPLSVSIQMDGRMTYADTGSGTEVEHYQWLKSGVAYVKNYMSTSGTRTGQVLFWQRSPITDYVVTSQTYYSSGINVPFNFAARHGSSFVNAALEGTALTANTTPVSLPDLSTADFEVGLTFMGTIGKFRVWSDDLTDTGIEEAST